jgi:hypothetical protein
MTFPNDNPNCPPARTGSNYTGWIIGAFAVAIVVFVIMTMTGRDSTTASNQPNSPATTSEAARVVPTTTGSGATSLVPTPTPAPTRGTTR